MYYPAIEWLVGIGGAASFETVEEMMTQISISHQMASCDLGILGSWKRFAETLAFFSEPRPDTARPRSERLLNLAQDTLQALNKNVEIITKAQIELSGDFMRSESIGMAKSLTQLFLFFLEMGAESGEGPVGLSLDDMLGFLDLATRTGELLFSAASPTPGTMTSRELRQVR